MSEILKISNLNYKKNNKILINNINLTVNKPEIIGLLGENGAGKTTLFRLIAGLGKGYTGSIAVAGETSIDKLDAFNLYTKLKEIKDFYAKFYKDFELEKFDNIISLLDIDMSKRLGELSKGKKEGFIVALSIARTVKIYLLDEPFSGIDLMSRKKILQSIIKWLPQDATVFLSDHNIEEVHQIIDRIVLIKDKTIVADETAEKIRSNGESIEEFYLKFY
ncbi:MAG: ATP-binding cassette domain-containing protein [Lactobacillus iners]|nr:ATP-binding cassette domain-containing protein [Lactobacillus iners]